MADASPLARHAATPAQLRDRIEAERRGEPFVVLRDATGEQRLVVLAGPRATVGRGEANDIALPWDSEVSRLHAELECLGGEWTVADDGLSRNGTYLNGARIGQRRRLRDGDVVRVGATSLAFRQPAPADSRPTQVASGNPVPAELAPMRRAVLVALARPYKHDELAAPATNAEIAAELHLSVDAVKSHLRALFGLFGIEDLPQNQKRSRLVAEALRSGLVAPRDL